MRTSWLLGAGLMGAALIYMLDPHQGARRRGRVRSGISAWNRRREADERLKRLLEPAEPDDAPPADRALFRKVRSRLQRAVTYPQLVDVHADRGRITLTGCVPAEEMESLMRAVRSAHGVRDIDNQLVATAGIESKPRFRDVRSSRWGTGSTSWTWLALLGAGAVAYGVLRRSGTGDVTDGEESMLDASAEALAGEVRPTT
jgi:hypothetical protein